MRYYFSPKIKWKRFKELNDPYKDTIYPVHGDKMLWELLRDRKINIYFDTRRKSDPIIITILPIPKKAQVLF